MGFGSCVALIIGACIGSAILSLSGLTICYAGPSAIVSWLLAAAIYGGYGVLVACLARRFPHSGGIYIFPKRAFGGIVGAFWGFISGWGFLVSNIIAISFSAIFLGKYLLAGFPSLNGSFPFSVCACILSSMIILLGGKRSQKIQNTLVALLLATLLAYCATAVFGGSFDFSSFKGFFTSGTKGGFGAITSVPIAMVAYGGCVVISFMAAEVSDPERNIPKSLFAGLGAVATVYILVIACVIGTLPLPKLQTDNSLMYIPLIASITDGSLSGFPWLLKLVSVSGVLALLTSIVALLRVNARAMQVMAREGLLPKFLSYENLKGTASKSTVLVTCVCILFCMMSKWTEQMITLGAALNMVCMTITLGAYIKSNPCGKRRNVRISILIVAAFIIATCYLPGIIEGSMAMLVFTASVYALGLAVYLFYRKNVTSRLSGIVVHGKGKGHRHGIPTANLEPYQGEELPEYGVWATRVMLDNKVYYGLTNVGLRPSDDDSKIPSVETLILDFDNQIYGDEMMLEFVRYIRETMKFDDLDSLRAQINKDIETVRSSMPDKC